MANLLTAAQWEVGKAWLFDIFWIYGKRGKLTNPGHGRDSYYYQRGKWDNYINSYSTIIKELCDILKTRNVSYQTFIKIDDLLKILADAYFYSSLDPKATMRKTKKPANILAKYIAVFCAESHIYWNNSLMTPYEMDEIKKTLSGEALWNYNCFVSQPNTTSTTTNKTQTTSGTVQVNKGYKASLGALSGKIKTLVGAAGNKQYASSSYVFCIEADKDKYLPSAYIKLLYKDGSPVPASTAEQVYIGRGNDYFDCKLYWFDVNTANKVLQDILNYYSNIHAVPPTNLHVAKTTADSNGYFEVSTQYGNAYIKAIKLNEEITEAADNKISSDRQDKKKNKVKYTNAYKIQDIKTFDEAFYKD